MWTMRPVLAALSLVLVGAVVLSYSMPVRAAETSVDEESVGEQSMDEEGIGEEGISEQSMDEESPGEGTAAEATTAEVTVSKSFEAPLLAISPDPVRRLHLDIGYTRLSAVQGDGTLGSFAVIVGYEAAGKERDFSVDMRLPFGKAELFLLGDIGLDFKWLVYRGTDVGSIVSVGFNLTLPSTLLNSLGSSSGEIAEERIQNEIYLSQVYQGRDAYRLLPLRYGELGPFLVVGQNIGPVSLSADFGVSVAIASTLPNLYHGAQAETAVFWDVAAAARLHRLVSVHLELGGFHVLTKVAGEVYVGGGLGEVDVDGQSGVSLTPGVRVTPVGKIEAGLGVPISVYSDGARGRYDITLFYRRDISVFFFFGFKP